MKVVIDGIIYQLQSHGGVSRIFTEILPQICGIDESLHITLFSSGPLRQSLPSHPRIHHHTIHSVECLLRPTRLWGPIIPAAQETARRLWLGRIKGAIWHSTYYTMPYPLSRLPWDGPTVVTVVDMIHERFPQYLSDYAEFHERKRRCIERADKVIAISESTKRDIIEYLHIPEHKIAVTYLAASRVFREVPQDECQRTKDRLGIGKPFILYVGTRGGYKNFRTLLEAYCLWKKRTDFHLICVGGENGWLKEEEEIINKSGLVDSLRLLNASSDDELRTLYSCSYVFVYPSLYEGFGIPPLEAMACGTPVIVSNTSSIPEVVGDAGLYFQPSSVDDLIHALDRIVDDSTLRSELVTRGLDRSKMFAWDKTALQTYRIYRGVL